MTFYITNKGRLSVYTVHRGTLTVNSFQITRGQIAPSEEETALFVVDTRANGRDLWDNGRAVPTCYYWPRGISRENQRGLEARATSGCTLSRELGEKGREGERS
ncbi:hypothetical protein ACHWQZ_G006415 [Mnemiopsis leidyi]